MKRHPKGAKPRQQPIQVWSYAQAQAAAPYIASIVRSLREHGLEALSRHRAAQLLARRPGRPGRSAIIAQEEVERQARQAEDRFQEAAAELQELDVYTLDPVQGQALVPFVFEEQLAWFIFDLFDPEPFRSWRFQSDPEDTRRPVTPEQQNEPEATQTV